MKYTYDLYRRTGKIIEENFERQRIETTTNIHELHPDFINGDIIYVTDNSINKVVKVIGDNPLLEDWIMCRERDIWMDKPLTEADKQAKAIDPPHYKNYIEDLQWLDAMSKIPTLRNPDNFCAALELQVRKYLDRRGQKDHGLQELKKARFYLQYWIKYLEHGTVYAKDVQEGLNKL